MHSRTPWVIAILWLAVPGQAPILTAPMLAAAPRVPPAGWETCQTERWRSDSCSAWLGGGLPRTFAETGDHDDDKADPNQKGQRQAERERHLFVGSLERQESLRDDTEAQYRKKQALSKGSGHA